MAKFSVGQMVRRSMETNRYGTEGVVTSLLSGIRSRVARRVLESGEGTEVPIYTVRLDESEDMDVEMLESHLEAIYISLIREQGADS